MSVVATGNDGPGAGTTDCGVLNGLCVGAIDAGDPLAPADDAVTAYSARGPTPDGRKKPDLVAVGEGYGARIDWRTAGLGLWRNVSGTSFSAPQVAGAAALVIGSGITDRAAVRALLIDSARQGRSTSGAAMGTQTGWQPDWGWGELDMTQALAERTHIQTGTVAQGVPRFFSSSTTAAGDRATLTWSRRIDAVYDPLTSGFPSTPRALTNIDLTERDAATCSARTTSASTVDNVEQVRSPGARDVIYAVGVNGTIEGRADEPFALASTQQSHEISSPVPTIAAGTALSGLAVGAPVTISADVANPSTVLEQQNLHVRLSLPTGVELVSGSADQALGTVLAGSSRTASWTVRPTGPMVGQLTIDADGTACGEALRTTTRRSLATAQPPVAGPPALTPPAPGPATAPTPPTHGPAPTSTARALRSSRLKILQTRIAGRRRRRLVITGSVSAAEPAHVTIGVRMHTRDSIDVALRTARIVHGRFTASIPIRRNGSITIEVRYPGDASHRPGRSTYSRRIG